MADGVALDVSLGVEDGTVVMVGVADAVAVSVGAGCSVAVRFGLGVSVTLAVTARSLWQMVLRSTSHWVSRTVPL
ncbi:MAG: hypothetical protein ACHQ4J_12445 [Candidatus Binatia bacterium]